MAIVGNKIKVLHHSFSISAGRMVYNKGDIGFLSKQDEDGDWYAEFPDGERVSQWKDTGASIKQKEWRVGEEGRDFEVLP